MFFEQVDPPAADPHRTQHLRNAYFLIYSVLGVILGIMATVGAKFRFAITTILVSTFAFFLARYRGLSELFNSNSEEGYFGAPALLVCAVAASLAIILRRRIRKDASHDQVAIGW